MEVLVEFDYIAQNSDELTIKKGERIRNVIRKEEGWYEGEVIGTDKIGLFPDNFVKTIKISPSTLVSKSAPYPTSAIKNQIMNNSYPNLQNHNNKIKKNVPTASPPPPPPPSILNQMHQQQQKHTTQLNLTPPNSKPIKPSSPINSNPSEPSTYNARVLYSYIPVNEDELAIQENEIVQVIRLVEDGWFEGISGGKQGVFPSNYVEKIEVNQIESNAQSTESLNNMSYSESQDQGEMDKKKNKKVLGIGLGNIFSGKTIELKTKENFTNHKTALSLDHNDHHNERLNERQIADTIKLTDEITHKSPVKIKARVLYEYVPTQPDELHLVPGEYVYIIDKNIDDEGWYRGESIANGSVGVFPDNFVEEVVESLSSKSESINVSKKDTNSVKLANELQPTSSMTNSSVSNSSSNNSLSKFNSVNKLVSPTAQMQNAIQPVVISGSEDRNLKSQSEMSEDLEELNSNEANKLVHMKKAKQLNKRPPSFKKKKLNDQSKSNLEQSNEASFVDLDTTAKQEPITQTPTTNSSDNSTTPDIKQTEQCSKLSTSKASISPTLPSIVTPVIVSSPIACQSSQIVNPSSTTFSRQATNLSEVSMATAVTNVDNLSSPSSKTILDEVDLLKDQLQLVHNENKEIKQQLGSMKSKHEEQIKKMQRILEDLVSEIDEEKKTRLALHVEIERLKKNITLNQ